MDWDIYFLNIAEVVRTKSKDPNTQIGAVIVGPEHQIISTGFNGFPRGVDEEDYPSRWERPLKYKFIEHAERNAIYNSARHGVALRDCTLYLVGMGPPTLPCTDCARAIIQSGITCVTGKGYKQLPDNWKEDLGIAGGMLNEAGVEFVEVS